MKLNGLQKKLLIQNEFTRNDLLIADSNFGMFNEDISTCKIIANQQKTKGYPKYINVATGKNRKEKGSGGYLKY